MLTIFQLFLRHALTALGGGLVTRYDVPGSEVEVIVGGVVTEPALPGPSGTSARPSDSGGDLLPRIAATSMPAQLEAPHGTQARRLL